MLKKGKINYKVKLFSISLVTAAFIILVWGYVFHELNSYKDSITHSYSRNQEILVAQVAKNVKDGLEAITGEGYSHEQAESTVVTDIISNAETSGSKYWFLYSSDGVIFEKNYEETRNLKGKTKSELISYWKLAGGTSLDDFEELLDWQQNGSAVFTKSADNGEEIVSIRYFAIDETSYFLGMSTQKQYVWSTERVNEHILYIYALAAVVSLALLILALLLCLTMYKNQKQYKKITVDLADKNLHIEELTNALDSKSKAVNDASVYDILTKLYNRKFFHTMLSKINIDYFQPITIAVMDINGLDRLNKMSGYRAGDDLLEKTSGILQRLCMDTDVVARTGDSEFSILMIATNEAEAYGLTDNIRRQFAGLDYTDLTLSTGVAQMHTDESKISSVLDRARKNLTLEKLNDYNSSKYSVVAMLMKMLNAYSSDAVAHCNRLKKKAVELGKLLGLTAPELTRLAIAAQLHDVGKIGISDSILNKKERLTIKEEGIIRNHPQIGYEIVKQIPSMDEVAVDILQHHEYYSGGGYPAGIKGEEISIYARIINIIDSYDAMTNRRVYAKVKTPEEAIEELRRRSNIQYDPNIVNIFIKEIEMNLNADSEIA